MPTLMQPATVRHQIIGHDMQAVEIDLAPEQTIIAEAGSLIYMEDGVSFRAVMGDGTEAADQGMLGTLWGAAKRSVTGAGVFLTHFTNHASDTRKVAFGANNPGKVLELKLADWNGGMLCEHHSFLCATLGTKVDAALVQRFGAGLAGGTGFVLQHLSGDGTVFAHACGSLIARELDGETLRVDPGALVAFSTTIDYSIERAGNLKTMVFGGDGLFLATLRGTGKVLMQSLPWLRVERQILERAGK